MSAMIARCAPIVLSVSLFCFATHAAVSGMDRLRELAMEAASSVAAGRHSDAEQKAVQLNTQVQRSWRATPKAVLALVDDLYARADQCELKGDYDQAVQHYLATLMIGKQLLRDSKGEEVERSVTRFLQRLGELHRRLGRFADAERYLAEGLTLHEKKDDLRFLLLNSLAGVHRSQGRFAAAEVLYQEALAIAEELPKRDPNRAVFVFAARMNLGVWYYDAALSPGPSDDNGSWEKAQQQFDEALKVIQGRADLDFPYRAECLANLGRLHHLRSVRSEAGRARAAQLVQQAEQCYRDALAIRSQHPEGDVSSIIETHNQLADLHYDAGNLQSAEKDVQEALKLLANNPLVSLEYRYNCCYAGAKIAWAKNNQGQALDHLDEAIAIGVRQRARGAGGPFDRGQYYTQLMNAAERMVEWRTGLAAKTLGDARKEHAAAAFRAMELTRALALQDQIALRGKDLFQGMDDAAGLKKKLLAAKAEVLGADINLRNAAQIGQPKKEYDKLLQAKRELEDVKRQIWNASPAVRDQMAKPPAVATLVEMQAWAAETGSLVLEYLVGDAASYVLAIRPGEDPVLEKVNWNPAELEAAWRDLKDLDGLIKAHADVQEAEQLVARARSDREKEESQQKGAQAQDRLQKRKDELHRWLADLYTQLIPSIVRENLAKDHPAWKRLVVVPDGPLVRLPFETLVTDNKAQPRMYLLDANLPIIYSPAGTMLVEAAKGSAREPVHDGTDVCFVGKGNFADHPGKWVANNGSFSNLQPLPMAAKIGPGTFPGIVRAAGLKVDVRSQEADTTERQVAKAIQQVPIVLFSTHGLGGSDETISSFGALVLTRPKAVKTLEDDGMFTYEEICESDLNGCELAIHAACDTNVGPNQRGEAAWAVSRGFLVAGAHRVLATQWSAEDNVSERFSAELARRLASQLDGDESANLGQLDYARAVHETKLKLREYVGDSPVLWAPWVLIGTK